MKTKKNYRVELYCEKTNESIFLLVKATSMYEAFVTSNVHIKVFKKQRNTKVEIRGIYRM